MPDIAPTAVEDELRDAIRLAGRDSGDDGWSGLRRLGAVAFALPVSVGGFDLGQAAAVQIAEELGRRGTCTPYQGAVFVAECLAGLGAANGDRELLDRIRDGTTSVGAVMPPAWAAAEWERGAFPVAGPLGVTCQQSRTEVLLAIVPGQDGPALALGPGRPSAVPTGEGPNGHAETVAAPWRVERTLARGPAVKVLLATLIPRAQLRQAAALNGLAGGAIDVASAHVAQRRQFGAAVVEAQSVRFRLAALRARLVGTRMSVRFTAQRQDGGDPAALAALETLALAAELAVDAGRESLHLHGAAGLYADADTARRYLAAACQATMFGPYRALWTVAASLRRRGSGLANELRTATAHDVEEEQQ